MRYRITTWEVREGGYEYKAERQSYSGPWLPIGNMFTSRASAEAAIRNYGKFPRVVRTVNYNGNGVAIQAIEGGKEAVMNDGGLYSGD